MQNMIRLTGLLKVAPGLFPPRVWLPQLSAFEEHLLKTVRSRTFPDVSSVPGKHPMLFGR